MQFDARELELSECIGLLPVKVATIKIEMVLTTAAQI